MNTAKKYETEKLTNPALHKCEVTLVANWPLREELLVSKKADIASSGGQNSSYGGDLTHIGGSETVLDC